MLDRINTLSNLVFLVVFIAVVVTIATTLSPPCAFAAFLFAVIAAGWYLF